jgi:hypothetical protein
MAIDFGHFMSAEHVRILTIGPDGPIDIGANLSSFTYNATINAFELRAPREANSATNAIPDLVPGEPLHVTAMGRRMCLIHFEAVTRVPVEISIDKIVIRADEQGRHIGRGVLVAEVVILRGARIELVK